MRASEKEERNTRRRIAMKSPPSDSYPLRIKTIAGDDICTIRVKPHELASAVFRRTKDHLRRRHGDDLFYSKRLFLGNQEIQENKECCTQGLTQGAHLTLVTEPRVLLMTSAEKLLEHSIHIKVYDASSLQHGCLTSFAVKQTDQTTDMPVQLESSPCGQELAVIWQYTASKLPDCQHTSLTMEVHVYKIHSGICTHCVTIPSCDGSRHVRWAQDKLYCVCTHNTRIEIFNATTQSISCDISSRACGLDDLSSLEPLRLTHGTFHEFSGDGHILAVSFKIVNVQYDEKYIIVLWCVNTNRCFTILEGHRGPVLGAKFFTHDDGRLLSQSSDDNAIVWDTHSGSCLHIYHGGGGRASSIAPNQTIAITGKCMESSLEYICLWDLACGKKLHSLHANVQDDSFDKLQNAAFTSSSQYVITMMGSNRSHCRARIWKVSSGCLQYEIHNCASDLVVAPDDNMFATFHTGRSFVAIDRNQEASAATIVSRADVVGNMCELHKQRPVIFRRFGIRRE